MISEKKNMYRVSMVMVVFLWITSIIFKVINYGDVVSGLFIWVFGLIILAYTGNYKKIVKENNEIEMLDYTVATGVITSIAYIVCIGFFFGRYFIRMLY